MRKDRIGPDLQGIRLELDVELYIVSCMWFIVSYLIFYIFFVFRKPRGLLRRDIKPENLLMDTAARVVVASVASMVVASAMMEV